jgi:hypothetical protein
MAHVRLIAPLALWDLCIYASPVTITKSPERQQAERQARVMLTVMACATPVCAAVVFWAVGLDVHPHRVVYAGVITGCAVVWAIVVTWLSYYARMKGARKL